MLFLSVQILFLISQLSDAKYFQLNNKLVKVFYKVEHAPDIFKKFIETFGKKYKDDEYGNRLQIFTENLREINRLNNASSHAVYGITHLHDLSAEEFNTKHASCLSELDLKGVEIISPLMIIRDDIEAPDSLDWRELGVVTGVKDQGYCGSCWAFSATGAIEGQRAKKYQVLEMLSEQQLIDCDERAGGCKNGGWMHEAFRYAGLVGGLTSENAYPYINGDQECLFIPSFIRARVAGGNPVAVHSEEQLKNLLFQYGPLSIALDASSWQYYSGGILKPFGHRLNIINHALLLVGYGFDNGVPYWTIKNSWSEDWGENGYVRIVRGQMAYGITDYVAVVKVL